MTNKSRRLTQQIVEARLNEIRAHGLPGGTPPPTESRLDEGTPGCAWVLMAGVLISALVGVGVWLLTLISRITG